MRYLKEIYLIIFCLSFFNCNNKATTLRVLQFNIWQEGTIVENGFNAIVNEIVRTRADLIALSEVRNYNGKNLNEKLIEALKSKGYTFYSVRSQDSGILSKYPIINQTALYPVQNDHGSITKAIINVNGTEIAFYSAHLDYLNCALYLPRGYDGSTWKKLDHPITDINYITKVNQASKRDEGIDAFIKDSKNEIKQGRLVIYGGDNNEPSHLDWIEKNKNMYDHRGVVLNWINTYKLAQSNFKDAYREQYPNPIIYPGFTFPANNESVPISKLAWSPEADDRDRIDFIFYYPDTRLELKDVTIVGPKGDIVRNKRIIDVTRDPILEPESIWPSDHKAVLASFKLN